MVLLSSPCSNGETKINECSLHYSPRPCLSERTLKRGSTSFQGQLSHVLSLQGTCLHSHQYTSSCAQHATFDESVHVQLCRTIRNREVNKRSPALELKGGAQEGVVILNCGVQNHPEYYSVYCRYPNTRSHSGCGISSQSHHSSADAQLRLRPK